MLFILSVYPNYQATSILTYWKHSLLKVIQVWKTDIRGTLFRARGFVFNSFHLKVLKEPQNTIP